MLEQEQEQEQEKDTKREIATFSWLSHTQVPPEKAILNSFGEVEGGDEAEVDSVSKADWISASCGFACTEKLHGQDPSLMLQALHSVLISLDPEIWCSFLVPSAQSFELTSG